MSEDTIHIEEDDMKAEEKEWTEEFTAAGEELLEMVKRLAREANVRRIAIRNEERGINLEIPIWLGMTGMVIWPFYAALGIAAALLVDCSIVVIRVEKVAKEKSPEDVGMADA